MYKPSKSEIVESLVRAAIVAAAVALTKREYQKKIKKIEIDHQIKINETFSQAFHSGWDDSRRYVHCYCAPHKETCALHIDRLYPDRKKD